MVALRRILGVCCIVEAARVQASRQTTKKNGDSSEEQEGLGAQLGLGLARSGQVLRDRYRLDRYIETHEGFSKRVIAKAEDFDVAGDTAPVVVFPRPAPGQEQGKLPLPAFPVDQKQPPGYQLRGPPPPLQPYRPGVDNAQAVNEMVARAVADTPGWPQPKQTPPGQAPYRPPPLAQAPNVGRYQGTPAFPVQPAQPLQQQPNPAQRAAQLAEAAFPLPPPPGVVLAQPMHQQPVQRNLAYAAPPVAQRPPAGFGVPVAVPLQPIQEQPALARPMARASVANEDMARAKLAAAKKAQDELPADRDPIPTIGAGRRGELKRIQALGKGSFGDVWEAFDTKLNRSVAIKLFYRKNRYLTWGSANAEDHEELKAATEECVLVKQILAYKHTYPVGAARICECYDEHVNDVRKDPDQNKLLFLVEEMCGRNLNDAIIEPRRASQRSNLHEAKSITKQLLQGLAFLNMFQPPLIHHDLKPDNVCITENGEVKIIDFGALVFGTVENSVRGAVATPAYMPPEAVNGMVAFSPPWSSYDTYAAGLIHMEMICPMLTNKDWYWRRPLRPEMIKHLVHYRCAHLQMGMPVEEFFALDVGIASVLMNEQAASRPKPTDMITTGALKDITTPDMMAFRKNDEVEYLWNEDWIEAIVAKVLVGQGKYDLQKKTGEMVPGVESQRVRARSVKATIAESFAVTPVLGNTGQGPAGPTLVKPVGVVSKAGKVVLPTDGGTPFMATEIRVEPPTTFTQLPTVVGGVASIYVGTSVTCDPSVRCNFGAVKMSCLSLRGRSWDMKLSSQHSNFVKAEDRIPLTDSRVGQLCEIRAYAKIDGRGDRLLKSPSAFFNVHA
eukprot:TRINITY_DN23030_c0_g3_i1.p2 TRINITY_DN23030_c0_g3~~TRINITY_DN23030_c0_g3_i1.p2  ORF type:complete len:840 (+),score=192.52 TRINITY_DN23030_c0_g3_i1:76-2595(+)